MADHLLPPPDAALPAEFQRALVIGLGVSGVTVARALRSAGLEVIATDPSPTDEATAAVLEAGATVSRLDPIELHTGVDVIVASPGVPEHAPVLVAAAAAGTPVWSEPELGWRLWPRRVVAITGTNGKTSVTELTTSMLQHADLPAVACGNIGRAFTEAASSADPATILVAELSSFQLRFATSLAPEVGVLLNLAPDHLDWHGDAVRYGQAKARIWEHQPASRPLVANRDDAPAADLARGSAAGREIVWFSGRELPAGGVGFAGDTLVSDLPVARGTVVGADELAFDAPHHRANLAAATAAALLAGASIEGVAAAARAFVPGRHRLEHIVTLDGVDYVDDSKATNAHAAAAALAAYPSIVWVAGGLAKGVDLSVLAGDLGAVRGAVLIGEAAEELLGICERVGLAAEVAPDIEAAVRRARALAVPGDTVLLAPACASFDQFTSYAERGDRFAAAARALTSTATPSRSTSGG